MKKVTENYSQKLAEPTQGFDCHMSEKFLTVSATTSSSLAFRRTQVCLYLEMMAKHNCSIYPSSRGFTNVKAGKSTEKYLSFCSCSVTFMSSQIR